MYTADQLRPILKDRLRDALNRRVGDTNRTGAMLRAADDLGQAHSTFKTRLYGETLPDIAEWTAMEFLWPGIQTEVLGDITGDKASAAERELADLKAELARLLDKDGNGRVVKLEGKIS